MVFREKRVGKMKIAIVSSFGESCGNASFTAILRDTIISYTGHEVEVITLNLKILQSIVYQNRKLANVFISDVVNQLKNFDAVNIQLETGLYGTIPKDIVNRVIRLATANQKTSVTLHSPRLTNQENASTIRLSIKKILRLKLISGLKILIAAITPSINVNINKKILDALVKNKCRLIVHTIRAQQQIKFLYNYANIDVHPLRIVPENARLNTDSKLLTSLRQSFKFKNDDVVIGMFGYLSQYKGHLEALRAMHFLPANYKLIIFGRQHPQTIRPETIDPYLDLLILKVCKSRHLLNRVFFMGELSHNDLLNATATVDVVWLPYHENGQDGSGIASICCDLSERVLASSSFAFDELLKLIPYKNVTRFDIGNYLEMAHKTQWLMNSETSYSYQEKTFDLQTQAMLYVKDLV